MGEMTINESLDQLNKLMSKEYITDKDKDAITTIMDIINKYQQLQDDIIMLQNRCNVLTKGYLCGFCKLECEHKEESENADGNND